MEKLYEETKATIERQVQIQAARADKHQKEMIMEEDDLMWVHLHKDRFPVEHNSKLKPRRDGPCQVLKHINNNVYVIDIHTS